MHCLNAECNNKGKLSKNNKPSLVVVCNSNGFQTGSSFSYRCRKCKFVYGYSSYGTNNHKFFYDSEREFVQSSNVIFIERKLMKYWQQLSLHSMVSFESLAICYNATYTRQSDLVKSVFEKYSTSECVENDEHDDYEKEGQNCHYLKLLKI